MNKMSDAKLLQEQYSSTKNLDIRIEIHSKYSTNKQGYGNWIYEHYELFDRCRILELGCGNGQMWRGRIPAIESGSELVLSDISDGMLEVVNQEFAEFENVTVRNIDIMDIPYEEGTFDIVIANMMLYHVPNLKQGLSEVKRVLKAGGKFYCSTFGIHGIHQYLTGVLYGKAAMEQLEGFVLQNGSKYLSECFQDVKEYIYEDSLEITDTEDLVDYFFTTIDFSGTQRITREEVSQKFEALMEDGIIRVPKDYGMFTCIKN